MARQPRLHVPGGFYHVFARGNGKKDIFADIDDRLRWEWLLRDGLQKYNHLVHAYCWMTNHVHLALQAGEKPLSRFIGSLLSRYAKAFNRKTGHSGHLFERRYGAILVEGNSYLLELVRYIHQNPQRARIVKKIDEYRWCSHLAYAGTARRPWLRTDTVLSLFSPNLRSARRQYLDFVGTEQPASLAKQFQCGSTIDNRALGDESWLNDVLRRSSTKPEFESLDQLVGEICKRHKVSEVQLASPARARHYARIRAEIALIATNFGLATVAEIAGRFGRSQPVLSRAMSRLRNELE